MTRWLLFVTYDTGQRQDIQSHAKPWQALLALSYELVWEDSLRLSISTHDGIMRRSAIWIITYNRH